MKTKLKIIIPTIIAIAAVITAAFCITFTPNASQNIEEMLSTAQKYLVEQNYEQAVIEFNKIIELDPMNADAYLGLAQTYINMGDTEKAVETLEKGFELTGDERLKEILNKLLENIESEESSENTIDEAEELTVTNESITENTSISTSEKTTDNIEEEIRAKAISVIEMFDVHKSTEEPNSVVYYYLPTDHPYFTDSIGPLTKCIYDEKGNLMISYETNYYSDTRSCSDEIIVHNWDKHSTEFYSFYGTYTNPDMSEITKSCYRKCFLDIEYIMTSNAHTGLAYSNFSGVSENCYTFENPYYSETINIHVDNNNEIIDITVESDWSVKEFSLENNNWIGNYSTSGFSEKFYPCENELPEGASDEDFTIPTIEGESCRTFYNWEEYNNYRPDIY